LGAGSILLFITALGLIQEHLEREFPSPRQWKFWTRVLYRQARYNQSDDAARKGSGIDWARSYDLYEDLLKRLENLDGEGKGLVPQGEEGAEILVDGVGRTGYDITSKPEPWRRGYYDTLMGCARGAEHLEGQFKDPTQGIVFPAEYIKGPSNPHPTPLDSKSKAKTPLEENCVPAAVGPEVYYTRILTTKGFTDKQRLDAALGYASWLQYKNTPDAAEEVLKWAMDIALSSVPDAGKGTINKDHTLTPTARPSSNLLAVTQAIAEHKARQGDLSTALPIFLSLLRARKALPEAPKPKHRDEAWDGVVAAALSTAKNLILPPVYPPPPPDGTRPPLRDVRERCEEAAIMTYIGEILYASKGRSGREDGLAWTREAVDVAETEIRSGLLGSEGTADADARKICTECLNTGLENWQKMVERLATEERRRHQELQDKYTHDVGDVKVKSVGWFGWGSGAKVELEPETGALGRWEAEEQLVRSRFRRVRDMLAKEEEARDGIFGFFK
jgi:hypothetical protein